MQVIIVNKILDKFHWKSEFLELCSLKMDKSNTIIAIDRFYPNCTCFSLQNLRCKLSAVSKFWYSALNNSAFFWHINFTDFALPKKKGEGGFDPFFQNSRSRCKLSLSAVAKLRNSAFLAHLTQRVMWGIAITWRPSSVR